MARNGARDGLIVAVVVVLESLLGAIEHDNHCVLAELEDEAADHGVAALGVHSGGKDARASVEEVVGREDIRQVAHELGLLASGLLVGSEGFNVEVKHLV